MHGTVNLITELFPVGTISFHASTLSSVRQTYKRQMLPHLNDSKYCQISDGWGHFK